MQAGKLRHLVDIQTNSTTRDTTGQPVASWSDTSTDQRAFIRPLRGNELMIARQVTPQVTHEITMRNPALTHDQRLQEAGGTRTFNILSIINVNERDHEKRILCVEEPS